jgi:photosystem II stability/assembly factor-like uncharacterized protein
MKTRSRSLAGLVAAAGLLLWAGGTAAQTTGPALDRDLAWRSIGPANMSGRITDIEALDSDFRFVVVGSASGGVWLSRNAGTTWSPIFDDYGSASIGDVAIFPKNPDILWVGTGEANNRNSVAWGDGIYKSTDGGQTFTNMGLKETHQIARVVTHPSDPDIVYVGAIGHLWGFSGDRGVFKTTDGGRTWSRIFYVDEKTGCTDLVMDPSNPNILYAAMYQRLRQPFRLDSGGPGGGIFKTTNGGRSWQKLTRGLPAGDTGRIGLAVYRKNPRIVMALVEAEPNPDENDLSTPRSGVYRSDNGGSSWAYVNAYNNRPFYYSQIRINPSDDQRVYLLTGSYMMSSDGGKTFERANTGVHGDYHAMWLDPNQKDRYYIGSDGGVSLTHDHNGSYIFFDTIPVSQFYMLGVDMRDPYWVYGGLQDNGSWGGPSNSRDSRGILTDHWFSIGGGDGFHAQVDPTDWRTVYVESQGGSISRRDALTRGGGGIRPNRNNTVNWNQYATPEVIERQNAAGWRNAPFRFNWSSPIVLSPHNPRTVFFGGNVLFKSVDRGESWTIISPDLSTNDPVKIDRNTGGLTLDATGAENHCTIITVSESPLREGLIWVGTDDGNVQLTRDGGGHWTNVRSNIPGVPEGIWVSRVEASRFAEGICYVTFDGHRSDVFTPWVFKTTDFGRSWKSIAANLPDGDCVYVIEEDPQNPDLLFLGTEFAAYASVDGGGSWFRLMNGMPTVAVHDLVVHPRDRDLLAGTHGRGIYILDDITPLEQLTAEIRAQEAWLCQPRMATQWLSVSRGGSRGNLWYAGENPPGGAPIAFWLKGPSSGRVTLEIAGLDGEMQRSVTLDAEAGLTVWRWDMTFDPTDEQRSAFVQRLQQMIDQALQAGGLEPARQQQLQQLRGQLSEQMSTEDLTAAGEELQQVMGGGWRGFGQLRGARAGPGVYVVKLTAGGTQMVRTLTIRPDPLDGGD